MRKKIVLISLLLLVIKIFGQGIVMNPVEIKSPQSYAFEKYSNVPVNLYTGSIDLKIPVSSIGEKELGISATLVYDSSGFIPHKKTDVAGVNWSLIAGGRITRNLNGIADEYVGNPRFGNSPYGAPYDDYHGFLKGIKVNSASSNTSAYNLYGGTGNTNGLSWWMGQSTNGYEGTPDVFNFNVMGLYGKFIIGNDGKVLVESSDPNIKVDISQMAIYGGTNFCIPPKSKITITDGQGTSYIFGGDFSKYEISYAYSKDPTYGVHSMFKGHPMISSFSLSKIIFKDNKEVDFNYEEGTLDNNFCNLVSFANSHNNEVLLSLESFAQDGARIDEWKNCPKGVECGYTMSSSPSNTITFLLLKKSILKSIKYLDDEIRINYLDTGYYVKQEKLSRQFFNEWVIDNIETYHNNLLIKKTQFSYDHLGGTFKRPFLKSIKDMNSDETYFFEYNKTTILPAYYTKGIDHWGYWNGNDSNESLAPFDTYNATTGDYTLNNTFRDANSSKYDVALLHKITYPTKGYTIFEYESQYYGKRLERTSSSSFLPTLTNNSGLAGGARIRKILNYAENGILSSEKEYKYTTTLNGSSSSGILMNWPRYFYYIEIHGKSMFQKLMLKSSSNVQQNSLDSYNVGYSKVFEINKNKGYIEHNFTSYETHPDLLNPDVTNIRQYMGTTGETVNPINLYKNLRNLYGVDKSIIRGRPLSNKFYSQSNLMKPIKTIDYEYYDNMDYNPNNNTDNNNYVSINHLTGFWVQGYRRFMNSVPIKKITTTDYLNGIGITTSKEYFYNSPKHLNLVEEKSIYPDGNTITEKLSYVYDSHVPQIFKDVMIYRNMKSIPMGKKQYKNNSKIYEEEMIYAPADPWVEEPYTRYLPKKFYSNFGPFDLNTTTDKKYTVDIYDDSSNIIEYTTENKISVALIWGYNKTRLIAKIEGKGYYDVAPYTTKIISASNEDNNDTSAGNPKENALLSALDSFRNFPALSDCQITTYTYDPLIGVRSITPPSGIRQVYIYDTSGRLKEIRENNQNGPILKSYKYHYKP